MGNKKPPFEITNMIIHQVAEIAELVGKLTSTNQLSANPTLRRTNRIRTIYGSLAIEQNTLSLEQVTAVLNGKQVLAPPKDIAEVKNAYEIYERLDELDPYSVDDLLTAHGIMTRGLVEEVCVSLWSCGQRLLLSELEHGLESNKATLEFLNKTVPQNYATLAILHHYSCLAELDLSFENYQIEIAKFLKPIENMDLGKYLTQKLSLSATMETADIIIHFEPKYIIMTGIAAGLDKDFQFGDIMVGTDIWNYSSGKYEEISENDATKVILSPDPKHISMPQFLQNSLTSHKYDELLDSIKSEYTLSPPVQNRPRIHFGPIACGVAVVASQEIVQQQVKAHGRKTIGLDMESYGVCYAAQTTITTETPVIIVKSISDLANAEKNDSAQPYAAYTSAKFAENLIRNILE